MKRMSTFETVDEARAERGPGTRRVGTKHAGIGDQARTHWGRGTHPVARCNFRFFCFRAAEKDGSFTFASILIRSPTPPITPQLQDPRSRRRRGPERGPARPEFPPSRCAFFETKSAPWSSRWRTFEW